MIVVRRKPIAEIAEMIAGNRSVLLVGCNTCAAVSLAGGEKEVATLAETLRLFFYRSGTAVELSGTVLQRQCEPEYVETLRCGEGCDAVLSLGCGAGTALLAASLDRPVYPALDTMFVGAANDTGSWTAECVACGQCVLGATAGICPMARCAKGILNGPCGGVSEGRCELGDRDCAWVLIHERCERLGGREGRRKAAGPKDHSASTGSPQWKASPKGGGR